MLYGISLDTAGSGGTAEVPFTEVAGFIDGNPEVGREVGNYQQYHPSMFETDPVGGTLQLRNPFRNRTLLGAPDGTSLQIFDGRTGRADCLQWNLTRPGTAGWDQTFPCSRANSELTSNPLMQATGLRPREAGPRTPAGMSSAAASLPVAAASAVPFAAPAGSTWYEWDRTQFRCTAQVVLVRDLMAAGQERAAWWLNRYLTLINAGASQAQVNFAWAQWRAWRRIVYYRSLSQGFMTTNIRLSGYSYDRMVMGDEVAIGTRLGNCQYYGQSLTHVNPRWTAPGPVMAAGLITTSDSSVPVPGDAASQPDYWAAGGNLTMTHGVGTADAYTVAQAGGGDYPSSVDSAPVMTGTDSYRTFACEATDETRMFAPGAGDLTEDLTGVFTAQDVLPGGRGTYQPASTLSNEWGRTSSGDSFGGNVITWDAERMHRAVDYRVSTPTLSLNMAASVSLVGGFPELDPRKSGPDGHTFQTVESYTGHAPGTGAGEDPATAVLVEEMETMTSTGPIRFYGAMAVTSPGGCTVTNDTEYTDFTGAENVQSTLDTGQNFVCLISDSAVPVGDCPGY